MAAISPDMLLEAMETGEPYPIKAMFMMQNNAHRLHGRRAAAHPAGAPEDGLQRGGRPVPHPDGLGLRRRAAAGRVLRRAHRHHGPSALCLWAPSPRPVEPQGECKSDQRIIYETGSRFTTDDYKQWDDEQGFYDYLLRNTGYTYEELRERTWAYPEFEYNKHEKGMLRPDGSVGFATSTGRYNFYCPEMLHFGLSPLADLRRAA